MAGGVLLQSAATTGNGNEWNCRGVEGIYTLSVVGAGTTITDGVIQWEQSPTSGASGAWAPLGTEVAAALGAQTQSFTGNPNYVRARIVTDVAGTGTPTVTVRMQTPRVEET